MRIARWFAAVAALAVITGCSDDPTPTRDTGVVDADAPDDARLDVGPPDAPPDGPPADRLDGAPEVGPDVATDAEDPDVVAPDAADAPLPDAAEDTTVAPDAPPPMDAPDAPDPTDAPDAPDPTDVPDAPDGPDGAACATSADCASSPGGAVCDTATGRCVRCTAAEDVCPTGNRCDPATHACVPGCRTPADCAAGVACDPTTRLCTGCVTDEGCAPGTICRAGACAPGCSPTRPCGAGATCCGAACVNTATDAAHCGACGNACGVGATCCPSGVSGACTDPAGDPRNCGGCGAVCSLANATAGCAAGRCAVAACAAGFGDCDAAAANGCETDTAGNAAHCGRCGNACPAAPGATATCTAGACGFACAAGRGDCDGDASNGCETALDEAVAHCGRCGSACPARPNAAARCVGGGCSLTCNAGFANCDGVTANGCEASLQTSAAHCGGCGRACVYANGVGACAAGACALAACAPGFGDCDGDASNGCETSTETALAHCGACGNRCAPGQLCSAGRCSTVCSEPLTFCAGVCVETDTSAEHCGRCGNRCPTGPNAGVSCAAGACSLVCARGFGNCDGVTATGCEVNMFGSLEHCGACRRACAFPNAAARCVEGACVLGACNAGFGDCDGDPATGCETDLRGDAGNCGACGSVCAFPHGTAACRSGACVGVACDPGFGECNGVAADGCETDVRSSTLHCSRCTSRCAPGQACASGACVAACPVGTSFCFGGCVDTAADENHCGRCENVCAPDQTCAGGACVAAAPANDTCAGATDLGLAAPGLSFVASTAGARADVAAPCVTAGGSGADVFYRFTLTRRELVYADTFAPDRSFDTVLYLLAGTPTTCAGPLTASTTPGDALCSDDAGAAPGVCPGTATASQVVALLEPGTYYLAVAGAGGESGAVTVRFEHLPAGNGPVALLPPGDSALAGATGATGAVASPTCGGGGPENAYWWRTCPGAGAGAFAAETCGTAAFDTVLHVRHGDGAGAACNDDACGTRSRVTATVGAGARLHALYVDGFGTASGTYTVRVTRP